MIADAPYEAGQTAIDLPHGLAGGLAGAVAMAIVATAVGGGVGGPAELLTRIGGIVAPATVAGGGALVVGAFTHLGIGAVLGLLYASCARQQPLPPRIAVPLSYGILTWIAPAFPLSFLFDEETRGFVRSPAWFAGCLSYGGVLLIVTLLGSSRRERIASETGRVSKEGIES